jgi:hypothetical protein
MDRLSVWHALSYVSTPLRALMLGAAPFAGMRCSAWAALVVSAAAYIPQGILLLVGSVAAPFRLCHRTCGSSSRGLQATIRLSLAVHDLKSLCFLDRLGSMAVGRLRFILGIKDQRDPSIFTGPKVKAKAIGDH